MRVPSGLRYVTNNIILDSSMAEHSAVNRRVVGSSPTRGARTPDEPKSRESGVFLKKRERLLGQAVKTSPFHGGNTGSIPVGVIDKTIDKAQLFC